MAFKQVRNDEMLDAIRADVQFRYEPNFAWKSAVSAGLALPALRAFWPMSSVDYAAATQCRDVSGGAYHLTNNNSADFGYDNLIPYVEFDGTNQYLSRADGGAANWADITGTEAYVAQPGLTLGGWFNFDSVAGAGAQRLLCKDTVANRQYSLYMLEATDTVRFEYFTGAAIQGISSVATVSATTWHFLVGRFSPSNDHTVVVDGTILTAGHANASIDDTGAAFEIGRLGNNTQYLAGKASLCFLCAAALSDAIVECFYQQTRAMYGV